jgi:hypothetical protein
MSEIIISQVMNFLDILISVYIYQAMKMHGVCFCVGFDRMNDGVTTLELLKRTIQCLRAHIYLQKPLRKRLSVKNKLI